MPLQSLVSASVPARQGEVPHPALLLLHGRGTDERDLLPLAGELDPRLYVVSARAPFRFPWGGYMWYELDEQGVGYPEGATLEESLARLRAFIGEMAAELPIDPKRLYAGGFSMGAAMSAALALTVPERVAGAMVLSGYLPLDAGLDFKGEQAAGHPVFAAHGLHDPVIPIQFGRQTRDALATFPVDLTYREYPIGHEISVDELRDAAGWLSGVLDRAAKVSRESPPLR
jgi:phospholipase/carboxylesterase